MKLVHADEVEWKRGLQHRGGTFHYRHLLEGEDGTPGNFHLGIGQQDGDFASPRHRHNFDQFRFQLEGTSNFDRNGKMTAGTFGYFPEGAAYGPQSSEGRSVTAVLQFGGASGSGYLSPKEVAAGTEELKKFGTFEGGVFRRNEDSGGRRNSDAYQAIWEHVHGRRMDYPKPRYRDPIMVDPENYDWLPLARYARRGQKTARHLHRTPMCRRADQACSRGQLQGRSPQRLPGVVRIGDHWRTGVPAIDCVSPRRRRSRRSGGTR